MKKLIALLLCLVMVASVFAGCQPADPSGSSTPAGTTENPNNNSTESAPTDPGVVSPYPKELADAEEIPYTPLYKLTFDDATNITLVAQDRDATSGVAAPDGGTYAIVPSADQMLFTNGPVGQCVYLDGNHGIKLENLVPTTDDTYTISFWVNASRLSDYMPSLQIGQNIGRDDTVTNVSWINVTQTDFFGAGGSFPSVWNRNNMVGPDTDGDGKSNGVWPWINKLDDTVYGKNEWIMVSIVATGEAFEHVDATTGVAEPRVGCYMYINGVEVMNGTADGITSLAAPSTYHGLSPEILKGEALEGYLGINYWDYTMKGFFDELYIYDEALTAGQIATLWAEGDATVESVVPEAGDNPPVVEPLVPAPIETVTPDANAIDVIGTVDRNVGFWADTTAGYELAEGGKLTMKLNNYSSCANNWSNYVVALTNTAVTTDKVASADNYPGYAEYGVARADSYGWTETVTYSWENSWTAWEEWLQLMADAEVTIVLSRNGNTVVLETTFVGADGTTMTSTGTLVCSTLTADAPCYVHLTAENAYVELLSVE